MNEIINLTGQVTNKPIMQDQFSGRYTFATMEDIARALTNINSHLIHEGEVTLNDFYDQIGLDPIWIGQEFLWYVADGQIEVIFGSLIMPNGWPALTLSFRRDPKHICRSPEGRGA